MMKTNVKQLLQFSIPFLIISIIFRVGFYYYKKSNSSIENILNQMADDINKAAPRVIDKETRLDNVKIIPEKTIQYSYTLINLSIDEINLEEFRKTMKPKILNIVKNNSDLELLKNQKVIFIYSYSDKNGVSLSAFLIKPEDYETK